ncbi:MAG: phage baseplate assembly protein V, partial [Acidimicrobiales bacterium]
YYLSEVRHLLIDGEYHTEFRCTGRLSGLGLGGGHDRSDPAGLGLGALQQRGLTMLPAIVTANREHPDGIEGMVKVKIPLIDDAEDIGWMRVVTPGAGANATVTFMPEIDDEVLVAFADGDIRTGYVLGGLYNGKDKPLEELASPVPGSVNLRGIRTPVGHYLVFDEDGNTVTLSDSNQSMLLLDASAETITLQGASGSFEINTSSGDITINAPGDMIFKSDKGVTIEAGMALTLKAGTDFKAEGGTNAELKAGVGVTVKGTTAELNGSATTTVKGAMVMIN